MDLKYLVYNFLLNFNKLSIKYQSYQKSRKINAFEQKINICTQPYNSLIGKMETLIVNTVRKDKNKTETHAEK